MCISLSPMALFSCGTAATCCCQLGLHWLCRVLGLEQYCSLKSVILLSHFLFFYLVVRSCSGTVDADRTDQVKDFLAKCQHWGRQHKVPWAVKDRCGEGTRSAKKGGVHTIHLNFFPFTKWVCTEVVLDFFSIFLTPSASTPPVPNPSSSTPSPPCPPQRHCYAPDWSQGIVYFIYNI